VRARGGGASAGDERAGQACATVGRPPVGGLPARDRPEGLLPAKGPAFAVLKSRWPGKDRSLNFGGGNAARRRHE
jgi:hypothetical protein